MATKKILETEVIAKEFGFEKYPKLEVKKDDIEAAKSFAKEEKYLDDNLFPIEEAVALARKLKEEKKKDSIEPYLYYIEGPIKGNYDKHRKKPGTENINLHIIDIDNSLAG